MSGVIDRNKSIAITLTMTAEQWQLFIQVLGSGPYNFVKPLIDEITNKCMEYAEPEVEHIPAKRPNGPLGKEKVNA